MCMRVCLQDAGAKRVHQLLLSEFAPTRKDRVVRLDPQPVVAAAAAAAAAAALPQGSGLGPGVGSGEHGVRWLHVLGTCMFWFVGQLPREARSCILQL